VSRRLRHIWVRSKGFAAVFAPTLSPIAQEDPQQIQFGKHTQTNKHD
jgi:hypothetical protein